MTKQATFLGAHPWWQPLKSERKTFVSPLSRAEAVQRVAAAIDPMFSPLGGKAAQGHVNESGGVVRRRIYYRNTFQTRGKLTFHDQGGRTRIEAQYGMAIMVVLIAAIMALVVIAIAVGFFMAQRPAGDGVDVTMLPFTLFPIVFLIGLTLTVLFLRSAARADKAFLDEFIKATLNAKET